eukprot:1195806-Prorocentrum_minimum.AAC.17
MGPSKPLLYFKAKLLLIAALFAAVFLCPAEATPPALLWKLKKVGGSSICLLLQKYAEKNQLHITAPNDYLLLTGIHDKKRKRHKHLNSFWKSATGVVHSIAWGAYNRSVGRSSPVQMEPDVEKQDCEGSKTNRTDVICCHFVQGGTGEITKWAERKREEGLGLMEFVSLRKPMSQMVAYLYYDNMKLDPMKVPPKHDIKRFIQKQYVDKNSYLQEWQPLPARESSDDRSKDALRQLASSDKYDLTVLIFERFDESLILMLDKLNLTLSEGILPKAKLRPHLHADDWPKHIVDDFQQISEKNLYELVYNEGLKAFDRQVQAFGKKKWRSI